MKHLIIFIIATLLTSVSFAKEKEEKWSGKLYLEASLTHEDATQSDFSKFSGYSHFQVSYGSKTRAFIFRQPFGFSYSKLQDTLGNQDSIFMYYMAHGKWGKDGSASSLFRYYLPTTSSTAELGRHQFRYYYTVSNSFSKTVSWTYYINPSYSFYTKDKKSRPLGYIYNFFGLGWQFHKSMDFGIAVSHNHSYTNDGPDGKGGDVTTTSRSSSMFLSLGYTINDTSSVSLEAQQGHSWAKGGNFFAKPGRGYLVSYNTKF